MAKTGRKRLARSQAMTRFCLSVRRRKLQPESHLAFRRCWPDERETQSGGARCDWLFRLRAGANSSAPPAPRCPFVAESLGRKGFIGEKRVRKSRRHVSCSLRERRISLTHIFVGCIETARRGAAFSGHTARGLPIIGAGSDVAGNTC